MTPAHLTRTAAVAVLVAACLLIGTPPASSQTPPADPEAASEALVRSLDSRTEGALTVDRDPITGAVTFVGTPPGQPVTSPTEAAGTPEAAAGAFVQEFGTLFGAASDAELEPQETVPTPESGGASVMYQQTVGDIPVMAGELRVQVNGNGDVLSAIGELQPGATAVDTTPTITASDAATEAATTVAKAYDRDAGSFSATAPELRVYAPDLMGGQAVGPPRLVWQLTVSGGSDERPVEELTLVDAHTGAVPLHFNEIAEARNRRVCDNANVSGPPYFCTAPVRIEGQDPSGNAQVDSAYSLTGGAYDFFKTRVGRDSLDGAGLVLNSIVRYCDPYNGCPMANAFWSHRNATMYFGNGYAGADDIVTHELSHGLVSYTAGLYYYYQSGAINEHLADTFGELMDQSFNPGADTTATRWLLGEDLPTGALRNMSNPPAFNHPDSMTSSLYYQSSADQGGVHTNSGVGNKAAYLITAGGTFNSQTVRGLGIRKATRVYYGALTTMLGSASDYADLARALTQSCTNAIGVDGITAEDCTQVSRAVTAVAMSTKAPNDIGGPAGGCPSGTPPVPVYSDDFEGGVNWIATSSDPTRRWVVSSSPEYATSGTHSLYGQDFGVAVTAEIRTATAIHLPANPSFLNFNHAFGFEPRFDYGTVALSDDGGTTWHDLGSVANSGGYNGSVNAIPSYNAWSGGYVTTNVSLAPYANRDVLLQFVIQTDRSGTGDGWWVDDVTIGSCPPPVFRPDAMIKLGAATYAGNDVYNTTAVSQTRRADVGVGGTATFTIKVQNDGNTREYETLSGPGSTNQFQVTYLHGTVDVTADVIAGTYLMPSIAPGANVKIKVIIRARTGAPAGAYIPAKITVTSYLDHSLNDTVGATVTRR